MTTARPPRDAVAAWAVDGVDVLYGSSPRGPAGRDRLLAALLAACPGIAGDLRLDHDRLGRPRLVDAETGSEQDVGISFAHDAAHTWAAVARGRRVGIDSAQAADFAPPYPYRRVFTNAELGLVLAQHDGRIRMAAAHLWALKEAAAKALGSGFHACDYREVEVVARVPGACGSIFTVSAGGTAVTARVQCGTSACLALAVLRPPGRRSAASL